MKHLYLDHAAATPVDARVQEVMQPYFSQQFYNPSASYQPAHDVRADVHAAQAKIAHRLGCTWQEIIFTSGGSEANNLAIQGVMEGYPEGHVLISAIEHESVLEPATHYSYGLLPVNSKGTLDLAALPTKVDDQTVLISVMQANNEIGTIQPLKKIAQFVKKLRHERRQRGVKVPLYLHTDATQAANYLDLHVHRLGVDMMTINGGKIYGPKGIGALFVRAGLELVPMIMGGGQQRGVRSGTENVPGAIGLATALEITQNMCPDESARLAKLQKLFIDNVSSFATINGSLKQRLPNNVHLTIAGQDNERLLMQLDAHGIYAAAGSACSARDQASSHVLSAIGLTEADARASLRFSLGRSTTERDIERVVKLLVSLI